MGEPALQQLGTAVLKGGMQLFVFTSIFLICLRSEEPYRVPYLPTIPTFFVRLACTKKREQARKTKRKASQHHCSFPRCASVPLPLPSSLPPKHFSQPPRPAHHCCLLVPLVLSLPFSLSLFARACAFLSLSLCVRVFVVVRAVGLREHTTARAWRVA